MENAKLKSSKVYAWVLVIALGLMSAGTTGSYSVIAGSFVAPVCEEFGFDYSIFSYYFTATLIGLAASVCRKTHSQGRWQGLAPRCRANFARCRRRHGLLHRSLDVHRRWRPDWRLLRLHHRRRYVRRY